MYSFEYSNPYSEFETGVFAVIGGIVLIVLLVAGIVELLLYILRAAGVYSIAKRRGIHHAWMAWLPVVSNWVLGCISDQYQYLVKAKNTRRRVILLVLSIVSCVLSIAGSICSLAAWGGMIEYSITPAADTMEAISPMLSVWGVSLMASAVSVVAAVFRYMSMYDLYSSVNPQYNVLFLVVSIFFNITEPFFIFCNRKKDLGMPPRKPEFQPPVYQPPAYQPPVYEPPVSQEPESLQQNEEEL